MASPISRRTLIGSASATALAAAVTRPAHAQLAPDKADPNFKVSKGSIRQSVMGWCFRQKPNPMDVMDLAKLCKDIGIEAMEGVSAKSYPDIQKLGLKISLVSGGHGFKNGPCDPKNHDRCVEGLTKGIDLAVKVGCPSVITFTGMRVKGMADQAMDEACVKVWSQVIKHAEKQKINLVLEHLNSRDGTHPMKGHPGYYGDDVDHCVDLIQRVGSPNMKLLFDIYHVQIMNGDVIRRIRQYKDVIGHYHTAGNPGRAELDEKQEINYPPILKEIVKTGYKGFVAQEFIPTWEDKAKALRHAAQVCDV